MDVLTENDVPGAKLPGPPEQCTIHQLKRWLQCHGIKQSGRKSKLVDRVKLYHGKVKVDLKVDGGKWYQMKKRI